MIVLCASVLGPDGPKASKDADLGKVCQEMMRAVSAQAAQLLVAQMKGLQTAPGTPDGGKQPASVPGRVAAQRK